MSISRRESCALTLATNTNKPLFAYINKRFSLTALIIVSAVVFRGALASAGQVQTLPSQQNLPAPHPSVAPFSNQNQGQGEETIPPPALPGSQGGTKEIPLPEVFRGCWHGIVSQVDAIVPIDPRAAHTIWLTKTYTLCYKQAGYNGNWVLTFAQGAVADRSRVQDQRQAIRVESVSGADRAEITAYLHFRSSGVSIFGMPTGIVNVQDELAHLHCYVMPDQQEMDVRAKVFVETDGKPSVNIFWHTRFFRSPS